MALEDRTAYPRLRLPDLIAFAMPNLCVGGLAVGLSVYLAPYYAGHYGLSLATVGLAFMSVRLVDTFFDPVHRGRDGQDPQPVRPLSALARCGRSGAHAGGLHAVPRRRAGFRSLI